MKLRYKYLLFNFIWFALVAGGVNLILILLSPPKGGVDWDITFKLEFMVLVFTSVLSQIYMSKNTEESFQNGLADVLYFCVIVMKFLILGTVLVGLIHLFLNYETFFIRKYGFALLFETTFVLVISRMYLSEHI